METLCAVTSASLLAAAILTMIRIVQETLPLLNPEDQAALRGYWTFGCWSFKESRARDRAIVAAWKEHVRAFPRSRKRLVVAVCFIAGTLTLMSNPLWLALSAR